jgi:hypothetical protein
MNGSVSSGDQATSYYFEYGTSLSYGSFTATNSLAAAGGSSAVSSPLASLTPGTTYHYRVVAVNADGVSAGNDISFVAPSVPAPQITGAQVVADHFQFGFTNYTGLGFTVLTTTNVALPRNQWDVLGHPAESPAGQYHFTDPQTATGPQRFYRVTQP